jgi:hypothetical protein
VYGRKTRHIEGCESVVLWWLERPCDYRDMQRLGVKKTVFMAVKYLENLNN